MASAARSPFAFSQLLRCENAAKETLLRIRLPEGWKIDSGKTKFEDLKVDENGTVDISELADENTIRF